MKYFDLREEVKDVIHESWSTSGWRVKKKGEISA